MSGRSTRRKAKVDYTSENFAGTPQWLRVEGRGNDENDSDLEPLIQEPQGAKRKSAPQGKFAQKTGKTAKRTSAPADTGRVAADKDSAAADISKQIKFKAEPEEQDTALPLSKRLEKHKRPRASNDDEPADEAAGQEPTKKRKQERPASAPSGTSSKPEEDSTVEPAAQAKGRGKARKSAPAATDHHEAAATQQISGNTQKRQKQKAKKEQPSAPAEAAASDRAAADRQQSGTTEHHQSSGNSHGAAATKNSNKSKSKDSSQNEEPVTAAAVAGKGKQKVSGSSKSTAKQAASAPATAATTAKSGASKKGSKSSAETSAADAAVKPESAAARAPAPTKKTKSKASSFAAAADATAADATVTDNVQLGSIGTTKQQQQSAAADAPAAGKPKADKKLPAAPPTPAGTEVIPANGDAAAAAASGGPGDGSGPSEFAKLQAEYRRLYTMYDELKAQKIQEMEGLVQEQDSYIIKMGEEARQLAEYWRKEAEQQRHTAASIKAPETARQIKQLQDNAIADKAALLEKDRELLKLQAEVAELKQKLLEAGAKPEVVDAAVQAAPEVVEAALDPLTADAAAAALATAQQTPAPPGRQFAACQFPTPAIPVVPSPGVGMQFPTPAVAGGSSGAAKHASVGNDMTDAAANAAVPAAAAGCVVGADDAAAAGIAVTAAALGYAGKAPYNTPGGINASMFPASSDDAVAAAARQAQPLPISSDSGAAAAATDPSTVRKQLQLSESLTKSQGGGSSPVRGLVLGGTTAKGGVARSTASQERVVPAPKPYTTPGGINAFMFNAATATGAMGALAGGDVVESVAGFAFQNEATATVGNGNSISFGGALQQQQQQPGGMQLGSVFAAGNVVETGMGTSGGNEGAGGSGGMQNSDHGSFVLDNRQQLPRGPMMQQGLGGLQHNLRFRAGLSTPPPAPHSTPVGARGTPAAAVAAATAAVAMLRQQQQQQGTPGSTGSLQRVRMRERQLADLRAALQQGVSPMCEKGGLAPAATAAAEQAGAAVAVGGGAAAAGNPVPSQAVVMRIAGVSPGRLAFSPMAAGHTPACTPASTPAALAAAAQRLPLDKLAAALAVAAAEATPGEQSPAAPTPPPAAGAADQEVGFAGFFSPQLPAFAAAAAKAAVGVNGLQSAAGVAEGVEATPLSGVVLPAVGTSDRRQSGRRVRISPQGLNSAGGGRHGSASASKHLMPLTYLCDFDPQLMDHGNIQYKHNATGFTFQLGPAVSTLTAPTPMTAQTSSAAWGGGGGGEDDDDDGDDDADDDDGDGNGWEEEISFVPVAMGAAEQTLPDFLKEPITFAPAAKPQFMKLLFQALADATKAAAAAAAEQQQRGGRAARNRRSGRHQHKKQQEGAVAAAATEAENLHMAAGVAEHADKENAAAKAAAAAAGTRKSNAAAGSAAGAVVGGHRQ